MEEGAIVDGPDGTAYIVRGGQLVPMGAPATQPSFAPVTLGQADPTRSAKAQADLDARLAANAREAAMAPLQQATAQAQLENLTNPRSAPPSGYRFKANGDLEPIPGGPVVGQNGVKKGNGSLDAIVSQINDVTRRFGKGAGATTGLQGLTDYLPNSQNRSFDASADLLEEIATSAFKVPGMGAQSDADAARLARAYKPSRTNLDDATRTTLDGLRRRVDFAREAAGLPKAQWAGETSATGTEKKVRDESKSPAVAALQTLLRSGAPDDQVQAAAAALNASPGSVAAALDFRRKNPGYRGSYDLGDLGTRTERTSGFERMAASPVGAYFANAANAGTAGLLGAATGTTEDFRRLSKENPTAGLLGEITGAGLGAAGLELGLGAAAARTGINALARPVLADAAFGGVSGATATPDNPLLGAAAGATLGAGGGMFGRAAGRMIGRGFRGIQNANVGALRQAGVPLTVGQAVGGAVKGVEDRLAGVPVIGDIIGNRRREGLDAFNRAAFDQGLAPINANTGGAIGAQGVDAARAARSQGYANALDNVQVQADAPFVADMQGAINTGRALPDPMSANLDYTLPTRVGNSFDANGGLSGRDFQQSIRGLRRDARAMENLPYGYDFGQVTRQAEGALEGLLNRQSPGTIPAYQAANAANRNVEVLRDAVNRARNGSRSGASDVFTPSQLADAAAQNSRAFGGTQGTTQQPFFNLTRAGQDVLPSKVPDSGTAGRLALLGLPAAFGGTGGGVGYATGDAQTGAAAGLGVGALLAAGGSRGAQALAVRALADRPDALIRIGNGLYNRAALGGMFGAGLGSSIPLLAQP